jgi:plastocyanin
MRVRRHRLFHHGLLLISALLALGLGTAARGATFQVVMGADFRFHPDPIEVAVGDSISWVNQATFDHTSTSGPADCIADDIWNSGTVLPGGNWGRSFHSVGTFPYFCAFHCSFGMTGSVMVKVQTPVEPTTWAQVKALFRK